MKKIFFFGLFGSAVLIGLGGILSGIYLAANGELSALAGIIGGTISLGSGYVGLRIMNRSTSQ